MPPQVAAWFALASALLLAALVHWPALRTFFAQDDITFLARARGLESAPWSFARLFSGAPRWALFDALFGLDPLPYHAANLLLHLANVALTWAVARRLLGGRAPAWAAAVLFGTSTIAFTPLHWATGLGELLATTGALGALLLFLDARARGTRRSDGATRETGFPPLDARARGARGNDAGSRETGPPPLDARARGSNTLLWLSALCALAAALSKETVLLLPLVLVVAEWRLDAPALDLRRAIPAAAAMLAFAAAFLLSARRAGYLGGEAYAMSAAPGFLAANLATYLRWCVTPHVAVRDAVAAMDPGALPAGLAVAVALALALWSQRRAPRHPEEVGAAWFLLLLAPVLPLRHHTYLYYVYPAWAGACWLIAGAGQRLVRRLPAAAPVAFAAVVALAGLGFTGVRARERAMTGAFPADRTVRESRMLRNVVAGLRAARLSPGTSVAFVNPAPRRHSSLAAAGAAPTASYLPLEQALRGGEAVRLFFPGLRYAGFADTLPRAWEDAESFLYQDDGTLRSLGRGAAALAGLGYFTLRTRQWARADAMFRRSLALGDTLADAAFGLSITSSFLGRPADERAYAAEFLKRWPDDPRAGVVRSALEGRAAPAR
ncbi:MAG: hypothetical protein HZC42_15080 [Candidatus Eisenbacteria bacterium]|nr:hypothetical protein [Candidatus Eisenbacteria bacterium]